MLWKDAQSWVLIAVDDRTTPSRDIFTYTFTFDALTDVVEGFTDAAGFDRYALYVFDYGAPTGFRLAVRRPERLNAVTGARLPCRHLPWKAQLG